MAKNNGAGLDTHQQEFLKLVNENSRSQHPYTVFKDFCELAALSFSNAVDRSQYEQREARYLQIIKGYQADEVARFPQMLASLTLSLEEHMSDCLGALFMALELGNSRAGQFFTPYPVCSLMARMICGDVKEQCKARGYVSVMEPAVGAGGMVIATAEAFRDAGVNYQQAMHATCIDIDATAVHMAYVQLSLLHVPAIIVHGNALSNEQWGYWLTPAHVLGFWNTKLKCDRDEKQDQEETGDHKTPVMPNIVSKQVRELGAVKKKTGQLTLF
ncbi:N-6 DNA methylase [Nitrosovibrio sp. Nv6]|uniref:N-6 DNA methylase n=1 Tax=Nitrosovibrio sp. Nv6 TaxID=1855340 RepID=UPI0008CBDBFF|nr:N-6 DNA methylase [Nitrosovibrio sp. Nv6]SEP43911.1 N-6 DNA Methylase [Nitrosovibrio sp. Nv6]